MEPPEREKIEKNLFELVRNTTCNESFLDFFRQSHVLYQDDTEALQATNKNHGYIKCSGQFYDIIQTRIGAYSVLIEALRKTNQSGALALLENQQIGGKLAKPTNYIKPPKYFDEFLKDFNTTLIISTPDCTITCNRMLETVPSIKKYDSPQSFAQDTGSQSSIPMIKCDTELEYIRHVLPCDALCNEKMILVVSCENIEQIREIVNDAQTNKVRYEDDVLTWYDLSPNMRISIHYTLNQFGFPKECCNAMPNASEKLLFELIAGKHPSLFKGTIDEALKYYIPRRLITRSVISSEVFGSAGRDLFLVKGVDQIELIQLVNGSETETSTNLLRSFNNQVKFAVLEEDYDFERLVEKVGDERAVHVVEYNQGKIIWRRSSAGINTIQQSVHLSQEFLGEDKFVENVLVSSGNDPICISDTPGMGKSILLMELARKLQATAKQSEIVGVVVISELIENIQLQTEQQLGERISIAFQKLFCDNEFAIAYFQKRKGALKHLLLDGLDELHDQNLSFGFEVVKEITKTFPEAKLWVTTRPHLFQDLEKHLNVLGFNIQAFDEEDQINFLNLFWSRNVHQVNDQRGKLTIYAKECLSCLKSQMEQEQDIAGVPLQCLLIGEVFEKDALRYINCCTAAKPSLVINSLTDLYTTLTKKKLEKFQDRYNLSEFVDVDLIWEHTYLSICLIFPRFRKQFEKERKLKPLSLQTTFNVGILESKTILPVPRFIHRTFAEYFIAKYVADWLYASCSDVLLNLLFKHILRTKTVKLKIKMAALNTYEFVNNVICYFIDSLIGNSEVRELGISYNKYIERIDLPKWKQLCHACAHGSFPNIFRVLIYSILNSKNFEKDILTDEFLAVCILRSEVNMVEHVCKLFNVISKTEIENIELQGHSLLHFAVIRGNFQIFEKLRVMNYFKHILLTSDSTTLQALLYACVADTKQLNSIILQDKLKIIRFFENMNKSWFDAIVNSKDNPVFAPNIHFDLVQEILNLTDLGKIKTDELLHSFTEWCSCNEFVRLIEMLCLKGQSIADRIRNALNSKVAGKSLLEKIITHMNPDLSFFQTLKNFGQDITEVAVVPVFRAIVKQKITMDCFVWLFANLPVRQHKELFASFFKHGQTTNILSLLQINPTYAMETFGNGDTLLHRMCRESMLGSKSNFNDFSFQLEIWKLLLSNGADINAQNDNFATPLDILMKSSSERCLSIWDILQQQNKVIYEVSLYSKIKWATVRVKGLQFKDYDDICQRVTGPNIAKDVEGNTLLHIFAKWQHYGTLKQLILLGADVHALNTSNETPLYTLAFGRKACFESWKMFIEHGADVLAQNSNGKTPIEAIHRWTLVPYSVFVIYAMNHEFKLRSPKVEEILLAALENGGSESIKVCEWYIENVGKPLKRIKFGSEENPSTVLDAVLTSGSGELLEYAVKTHGCTHSLQHHTKTWFCESLKIFYGKENLLTIVNKLFPDLIHTADEHGIVPLSQDICSDAVKWLVRLGANVNASDSNGNTPLHHALMNENSYVNLVVKALVDCGADVNASNKNKETPLLLAASLSNGYCVCKCINILINAGADAQITDASNNTILHLVPPKVQPYDFHDIVKTMLENGYSGMFHLNGENNLTPLQTAERHFKLKSETVSLLKEHGINLE